MRQETFTVKAKDGSDKTGTVFIPESLGELEQMLGTEKLFSLGKSAYLKTALRRLATGSKPRRRILKLSLDDMTEDQVETLKVLGLL